jgi:hypothetical protein
MLFLQPIPLDLLTLTIFNDPPTQRGAGFLRNLGTAMSSPDSATDTPLAYPFTFHHSGRLGGLYTLYADSIQARAEWKQKLEEAIGLRRVVQESNKVFDLETLNSDTFLIPSGVAGAASPSRNLNNSYPGKVTCSVPFCMCKLLTCLRADLTLAAVADGRDLVAIGCAEGVWIGFRHDPRCRVSHSFLWCH